MIYLIGWNALLHLSLEGSNPVKEWLDTVEVSSTRLSVIGVGIAQASIEAEPDVRLRKDWDIALRNQLAELQSMTGPAIPIDERVIKEWTTLRDENLEEAVEGKPAERRQIGQDMRLEIAVAVAYNLKLVDLWQPYHEQLRDIRLGRFVESIGQSTKPIPAVPAR